MLVIRADANSTIGIGHVMRCIALAEAWIELGGRVTFAMRGAPRTIVGRIERLGARVVLIEVPGEAATLAAELGARYAVVDGYHLGAIDQDALAAVAPLVVIDDRGETATAAATVVLNHNPYATPAMYAHLGGGPRLLLGRDYVLLRREFRAPSSERELPARALRVLVSFGGADPANLTPRVLEALAPIAGLEVLAIAGAANSRVTALHAPAGAACEIRIVPSVDNIAVEMHRADLAIVAAGVTCWELAACGVPVIAIPVADNQLDVAACVGRLGLGVTLPIDATVVLVRETAQRLVDDSQTRAEMSRRGRQAIDGRGALRVCEALRSAA